MTTKAALNLITPAYLRQQEQQLLNRYSHLKSNVRTKIGVLLGGDAKGVTFTEAQAALLVRQLKEAAAHYNADILITTSRRTAAAVDALIAKAFKGFDHCALCIIANENNIPEAVGGILALSDIVIVSGESISMVSEAAASGKRTIVYAPQGDYGGDDGLKYTRFVQRLSGEGYVLACGIKDLGGAIMTMMSRKVTLKVLNDRAALAAAFEDMA